MGHPAAFGWQPWPMLRSFVAYQMWGLGLSLCCRCCIPRHLRRLVRRDWDGHHLAA